ncbi:hypothetical protein [Zavarzinia sp. CC-PAN008]|uniref:hypothetical protein n=1 Tax=Zavarzinia sp. CC-PAN008 TaxID=3243332 RepID=UPI003F74AA87
MLVTLRLTGGALAVLKDAGRNCPVPWRIGENRQGHASLIATILDDDAITSDLPRTIEHLLVHLPPLRDFLDLAVASGLTGLLHIAIANRPEVMSQVDRYPHAFLACLSALGLDLALSRYAVADEA